MVRMVEHGFALSRGVSNMPAMMELRIRACHVRGSFEAKRQRRAAHFHPRADDEPASFDYMRLAHPPVTFRHEKLKVEQRIPAAQRYIVEHRPQRAPAGCRRAMTWRPGLIVQGGLYNRPDPRAAAARAWPMPSARAPSRRWCSTSPTRWCRPGGTSAPARRAVLVLEEGHPEYIEKDLLPALRRRDVQTRLHGKDLLPTPANTAWR
jgi:indolepyruvate ferredoxin oxidoreductase alpha subunit